MNYQETMEWLEDAYDEQIIDQSAMIMITNLYICSGAAEQDNVHHSILAAMVTAYVCGGAC